MKTIAKEGSRPERARVLDVLTEIVTTVAILSTMLAQLLPHDVLLLV